MTSNAAWIAAVPLPERGDVQSTAKQIIKQLNEDGANAFAFPIPALRAGSLDSLLQLSDDLLRIDASMEAISLKIMRQLAELANTLDELQVARNANQVVPWRTYVSSFEWDGAQYSVSRPIRELTDAMYDKVVKVDEDLKLRTQEVSSIRSQLNNVTRKETGNLSVRSLVDIVTLQHVVDSEFLTTLYVAVPRSSERDWLKTYETLGDCKFVVPRSSQRLSEDNEYALFTVVLFKRFVDDYKQACRDHRFVVREFTFRESLASEAKTERSTLEQQLTAKTKDLLRVNRSAFSEAFSTWCHLKALRTFVEAVLRYGLPPRFAAVLVFPSKRGERRHVESLAAVARANAPHAAKMDAGGGDDISQNAILGGMEFHPFVLLRLNVASVVDSFTPK